MRITRGCQSLFGIMLMLMLVSPVLAQRSGGDFCVRAFEDRNANTIRDMEGEAFEPLLRTGIGADLLDETGVIVASALMADSPTAEQGVICFQFLPDGQYTIQITSAEYRATTPDTMTANIRAGELPAVMELGVQSLMTPAMAAEDVPVDDDMTPRLERLLIAGAGAVVAALIMQVLGLIIYLIRFGRRRKPINMDTAATVTFRRPD